VLSWKALLCSEQRLRIANFIKRFGDRLAHDATAFATIELAAMMRLHGVRTTGARANGVAHTFLIDPTANTNDHENHLQLLRMIVNKEYYVASI